MSAEGKTEVLKSGSRFRTTALEGSIPDQIALTRYKKSVASHTTRLAEDEIATLSPELQQLAKLLKKIFNDKGFALKLKEFNKSYLNMTSSLLLILQDAHELMDEITGKRRPPSNNLLLSISLKNSLEKRISSLVSRAQRYKEGLILGCDKQ